MFRAVIRLAMLALLFDELTYFRNAVSK